MTILPPDPNQSTSRKPSHQLINPMLNSKRTTAFTAIAAILAAGISFKASIDVSTNSAKTAEIIQQPILPGIYERVNMDMAIVEVQAILGPGIEISSSKTIETYQWKDRNGNCITATFKDGLLQEKNRQCSG